MGGVTEDGRDEGGEWEYGRSVPRSETSPVVVGGQEEEGQGLWEAGGVLRDWEGKGSRELDTLVYRPSCSISPVVSLGVPWSGRPWLSQSCFSP